MDNITTIDVIYPLEQYQRIFRVKVTDISDNPSILEVINKSGILDYYPQINLNINPIGINSELKKLDDVVKPFDRIEIYRPLVKDPMTARRMRAKEQRAKR